LNVKRKCQLNDINNEQIHFFSYLTNRKWVLPRFFSHVFIYKLLMVMWDTSVSFTINRYCAHSFIHSSFHLISAVAKARQASISFSFFLSFSRFFLYIYIYIYSIWFPLRECKRKNERGKNPILFHSSNIPQTIDHWRATSLIIDPLDSREKKKREGDRSYDKWLSIDIAFFKSSLMWIFEYIFINISVPNRNKKL
jgi:hypothetical protein